MIAAGLLVGALVGLSVLVGKRELRRWRDARSITARFDTTPSRWWTEDSDGNIEWHEFPTRKRRDEMALHPETCPTCKGAGLMPHTGRGSDGFDPCPDAWHMTHGSQLEREVASFVDAQRRTKETLESGEAVADEAEGKLASLVGVPEGVGPPVRPDCPICTGGRGLPCAWHALS